MKSALTKNAAAIIIAHNHLSDDVTPSQSDISLTLKISCLLKDLDITLLDHIITGEGKAFSFAEQKLICEISNKGDRVPGR